MLWLKTFLGVIGGRGEDRTLGLCIANAALSQLSYAPPSVCDIPSMAGRLSVMRTPSLPFARARAQSIYTRERSDASHRSEANQQGSERSEATHRSGARRRRAERATV